eukprot:COSAG05_NODE_12871_length_451_cov_0.690341_1_plen_28_part_10
MRREVIFTAVLPTIKIGVFRYLYYQQAH